MRFISQGTLSSTRRSVSRLISPSKSERSNRPQVSEYLQPSFRREEIITFPRSIDPIVLKTRGKGEGKISRGPWFERQGCREDRLHGEIGVVHQITPCPRTACKSYLNWRWQVYPLSRTCMLPLSQLRGMAVSSLGRWCHQPLPSSPVDLAADRRTPVCYLWGQRPRCFREGRMRMWVVHDSGIILSGRGTRYFEDLEF